jgi:alpha-glucosidase
MAPLKWWQTAVFYQIYPRSFDDGNGDGIGDFAGMIARLDYLVDLGIDAIWLSPYYPSPQFDCGYDISNYTGVAPEYGSLEDFKAFLEGAHQRGLRVITDLVLNHTSHQHPWFLESKSSRTSQKRDWYVWRDGRPGKPPNNWLSWFGGPAWEYDSESDQYYYHFFFKEQPDLNWRNPAVKQAMFAAARFWLDSGVDGFRLDAIGTIFEDASLDDQPGRMSQAELYRMMRTANTSGDENAYQIARQTTFSAQVDKPEVHKLMGELRSLVDEYGDRMLVGETEEISYYGNGNNELHLVFNFPLLRPGKLTPQRVRLNQAERLGQLPPGAWPCNTLGNHDVERLYGKFGDGPQGDQHQAEFARLSLALMLTLKGTPFLYYGEEIGMTDLLLDHLELFRDNLGRWAYEMETSVMGASHAEAIRHAAQYGRDKNRTPMQWRDSPNGGFSPSGVTTWLPVNPNFISGVNVEAQQDDPGSLLNFYRQLLRVRRQSPALIAGDYYPLLPGESDCLVFLRIHEQQTCLVALNLSGKSQSLQEVVPEGSSGRLKYSSRLRETHLNFSSPLLLEPYEIFIADVDVPT